VAILNLMRASMESQCSLFKLDKLETVKPVPVTTRAAGGVVLLLVLVVLRHRYHLICSNNS